MEMGSFERLQLVVCGTIEIKTLEWIGGESENVFHANDRSKNCGGRLSKN